MNTTTPYIFCLVTCVAVVPSRDAASSDGYIWSTDPANFWFQMYDNDGPLTKERNFWMFQSNRSPWDGIVGADAYGGYLSFDVITFSEFHFVAQRLPLVEVRLAEKG